MLNPLDISTLEEARKRAGLSRSELAERAGLDETTIWRIETGRLDPSVNRVWSRIVTAIKQCRKRKLSNGGNQNG